MKNNSRILIFLSFIWAALILALGWWWIYLILNLKDKLVTVSNEVIGPKFLTMIQWEGLTFFISLIFLSITLLTLYIKDLKKTKMMQVFLASLTHELKTPLASIRLQSDVINDLVSRNEHSKNIKKLSERLIEDTTNLETQMDKVLQLSRLEQGGNLNLQSYDLVNIIQKTHRKWASDISLVMNCDDKVFCYGDNFAIELILRNLFENTKIHAQDLNVKIMISIDSNYVNLIYSDTGAFCGKKENLGKLFYKHNSQKGSGIGLYLCKQLVSKMNGRIAFKIDNHFKVTISLPKKELII